MLSGTRLSIASIPAWSPLPLHQVSLRDQRLHQLDEKERLSLRALMQPAHQGLRQTMPRTATRQIRRHSCFAEPLQRQLDAVPLPLYGVRHGAERVPLHHHFSRRRSPSGAQQSPPSASSTGR
jgi:hypothetical protein